MREIKFRAFDKKIHKMYYDVENLYDNLGRYGDQMITKADSFGSLLYGYDAEDFEVMQFTGLLDKNGKEIYEGDIVRKGAGIMAQNIQVIFRDGAFVGDLIGPCMQVGMTGVVFVLSAFTDEIEVIGNIYENPELLEGS